MPISTSLLYHGFGISGYTYVRTEYVAGNVVFHIFQEDHTLRCPCCNTDKIIRKGVVTRIFRALPIGGKQVYIVLPIARVFCPLCQIVRQVKISFASRRRSYTHAFERYVLDLSKHMTIKDVANHLGANGIHIDKVLSIWLCSLNREVFPVVDDDCYLV